MFRSVTIDPVAFSATLEAPDGTTVTITKADLQTVYQGASGNAAARRLAVLNWIKNQFGAAAVQIEWDKVFFSLGDWKEADRFGFGWDV